MWVKPRIVLLVASVPLLAVSAAYLQWACSGLPAVDLTPGKGLAPHQGFPPWIRLTHYVNLFFLILLVRSGLQILMDHPRLYWSVHCTPGSEWLRLTPVTVPKDRVWTAKEDARALSPWIGLPGYRHTVGMARHWHFLSALFWVANGLLYVALLAGTGEWRRLAPTDWHILPQAWSVFVHYATFHLPPEPDAFAHYNALQQLSYFAVVFILAPAALITGPSMSPAFTARFTWYPRLPGNRQVGRSLHFAVLCAFLAFVVVHTAMVALTGLTRNLNHIVLGTDSPGAGGAALAGVGILVVIAANVAANWLAWRHPRTVQHAAKRVVTPIMHRLIGRRAPRAQFRREDISPFFWINGSVPTSQAWERMEGEGFRSYRLRIHGAVRHPVELSLDDLRRLELSSQITLHHCIQGWSGIAEWSGVRLASVLDLVQPLPTATAVVFHSFGDGIAIDRPDLSERYYDSLALDDARHPQTLLATGMNGRPLDRFHGAPLRLRVENQLGFKMVKWIESIEIVEDIGRIRGGEGGFAEDNEYFGDLANI